jgi:hypothetical protein
MIEENKTVRIGDVLTGAGVLTAETLTERLEVAKLLGQPLGQTLVQSGDVTRYQLLCAVQLQSLCLDGVLSHKLAIDAMKLVHTEEAYLEDALKKVGFVEDEAWTAKLGGLLLQAELITDVQLTTALDLAFRDMTPLGQILVQHRFVTPQIIARALAVQRSLRNRDMSRAEAIEQLKAVAEKDSSALDA